MAKETAYQLDLFGIGKRIRQSRESMNLTRDAFAEMIPMSTSFLADVEGGTKKLSLEKFAKVVDILDVSADYILFGGSASKDEDMQRQIIFEKINNDLNKYDTEDLMDMANAVRSLTFIIDRND